MKSRDEYSEKKIKCDKRTESEREGRAALSKKQTFEQKEA